jgi:hypothetical protein
MPELWHQFSDRYNLCTTIELKDRVVRDAQDQAFALDEDMVLFNSVLDTLGLIDNWPAMPCLMERALFYGEDVWIVSMIWGVWLQPSGGDLGHYWMCVVSCQTLEILAQARCL